MNEILGALYIELDTKKDAEIFEQEMFKTVMESITLAVENLVLRMELIEQSKRDQLTKLYNRNYLEEYIETLEDKKYSLAMIDVDFFKRINDKYGHKAGDDVLKYVSSVLNKLQEYYCEVFRIGGEEFLIIAQMSKETLAGFLEDIRREIEHKELIILDKVIKVTISTGITDSYDGKNFEDVQKKADQELYKVKSSGRNQVSTYVE
jgi:diguanylate cyclase (GGDEF)-like protein